MPRSFILKLNDETYKLFTRLAEQDNRLLPIFIETTARLFIKEHEFAMAEIRNNRGLNSSLRRAHDEAEHKQGEFIG